MKSTQRNEPPKLEPILVVPESIDAWSALCEFIDRNGITPQLVGNGSFLVPNTVRAQLELELGDRITFGNRDCGIERMGSVQFTLAAMRACGVSEAATIEFDHLCKGR